MTAPPLIKAVCWPASFDSRGGQLGRGKGGGARTASTASRQRAARGSQGRARRRMPGSPGQLGRRRWRTAGGMFFVLSSAST
jgi:hypothetical protein